MSSDKRGDGFAVALEAEAERQFIGGQLKVGRFLKRYKIFKKLDGRRRPIGPVVSAGDFGAESGTLFQPTSAQAIQVSMADLEMLGRFWSVDFPAIKQSQDMVRKGRGQAFGQLFFSWFNMNPAPLGRGSSSASATLRPPQTLDQGTAPTVKHLSPFDLPPFSFCSRPDSYFGRIKPPANQALYLRRPAAVGFMGLPPKNWPHRPSQVKLPQNRIVFMLTYCLYLIYTV